MLERLIMDRAQLQYAKDSGMRWTIPSSIRPSAASLPATR
jgi:hypothetical protein